MLDNLLQFSKDKMYPGTFAITDPDKPALIMAATKRVQSYRELNARSIKIARLLDQIGVEQGETIAILSENNLDFLNVCWAAQRSGRYYSPISFRFVADEISYILEDSDAKALFVDSKCVDSAKDALGQLKKEIPVYEITGDSNAFLSLDSALESISDEALKVEVEGQDLLYSPGTTGKPKGVKFPLKFNPITAGAVQVLMAGLYNATKDCVYLCPAPLYHAAPLRFTMAISRLGGTAVIMDHFEEKSYLSLIEQYRVTHTQVVPTMFIRLLKYNQEIRHQYDLSSLRCIIHAAAPCPIEVKKEIINWFGPIIYEYYAGTEGNGFVACNSEEWLKHPGTVGKPLLGKIHILDENHNEQPVGCDGVIYFEGGQEFEYLNDKEKTKSSRTEKGWTTLGDIGHLDKDGYLYLTDRLSYMIISGGINIYPQEVENVLISHPKVADVAVFGIPNEEFGEEVKAVVQPMMRNWDPTALEQELISFAKTKLASYKCPKSIDFKDELPRHPNGKLYKRLLREEYLK
jgi:long-chain acyl-CoA synthetase